MIKGTTPTHIFALPIDTAMIKTAEITYVQNGVIKLRKSLADCEIDNNDLSVKLTQEDTFLFADGSCVEIQLRVLTLSGDVLASNIMRVHCNKCLSCEVLS